MRKLLVFVALGILTGATGCSQSPESHCEEAMDHMTELLEKDPLFTLASALEQEKATEQLKARQEAGIKKCVAEYDKDMVDCMLKAETKREIFKCN